MKLLNKIGNILETVCKVLVVIVFAVLTFTAFMQVVSRTLLGGAWPWTDELCRFCLVWLAMLGAGYGMRKGTHLSIDTLVNLLSPQARTVLKLISLIMSVVFSAVILYYGIKLCSAISFQKSTALHLPMGVVYSCVPLFGLVSIFFCTEELLMILLKQNDPAKEG